MSTLFLGALNDNVFKLVVCLLIINFYVDSSGNTSDKGSTYLSLAQILFVLPYILFSTFSGILADKFSKVKIVRTTKLMEVIIMSAGFYFFMTENITALLCTLFFMGLQSALFSPCKYGLLPEMLDDSELSKGNGYLEFWTFIAIICGTALSGVLKSYSTESYLPIGIFILTVSIVGFIVSFKIKETNFKSSEEKFFLNPIKEFIYVFKKLRQKRGLYLVLIASTYFWFVGALLQLNILLYSKQHLILDEISTGAVLTVFALGIGLGSIFAGIVSEGKVELGLVPLGAIGLSVSSALLYFSSNSLIFSCCFLFVLGFSGGCYVVPLNSYLQHFSPKNLLGRYIGVFNIFNFTGMFISGVALWVFQTKLNLSPSEIFLFIGLLSIIATYYICTVLPEMLLRCLNWIFIHTLYRLKIVGLENLPKEKGALLVCNHVSYVDASLLLAATDKSVRFLMFKPYYELPLINKVSKIMQVIPIAGGRIMSKKEKEQSLSMAKEMILKGDYVGIFAEGHITRDGDIKEFKGGYKRIIKGTDIKIIPVKLDGLWGSIFSFKDGKAFWKFPKKIPYPLTIKFGEALPSSTTPEEMKRAVESL